MKYFIYMAIFVLFGSMCLAAHPGFTRIGGEVTFNGEEVGSGTPVRVDCEHNGTNNTLTDSTNFHSEFSVVFNNFYEETTCLENATVWITVTINETEFVQKTAVSEHITTRLGNELEIDAIPEFTTITAALAGLAALGIFAYMRRN